MKEWAGDIRERDTSENFWERNLEWKGGSCLSKVEEAAIWTCRKDAKHRNPREP